MATNRYKSPHNGPQPRTPRAGWRLPLPSLRLKRKAGGAASAANKGVLGFFESNLVFAGFLTLIGVLYIMNVHLAERQARREDDLTEKLKALRSVYMTQNARLSVARQQTAILAQADSLGLMVPAEPPFRLDDEPAQR